MNKVTNIGKKIGVSVVFLGLPLLVLADAPSLSGTSGKSGVPATSFTSVGSVLGLLCTFFGWAFYLLITLAVIFVLVAAYRFLTSNGDQEKVRQARNTILYAAIAVAVALLATAIPVIVGSFLTKQGSSLGACAGGGSDTSGQGLLP